MSQAMVKSFSSDVPSENPLDGVAVELDDELFECKGRLGILDMSELALMAITPGVSDAAEAGSIFRTLSLAFGPEEYTRLKVHIDGHQTPDETVLGILQHINEAVQSNVERITARPTRRSSSSSGGPTGKAELPVRSISLSKGTVAVEGQGEGEKAAVRKPKARTKPETRVRRTG